ncbi:hypothetical protein DFJ73DRAFT_948067 [Zopfochytrium polystomum]|nr:hypothetical protein DFJ73DRAFT_948067 [Zopfochytrium polystomum]
MLPFRCLLALLGALLVLTLAPSPATALPKNDRFVYHSLPTADARAKVQSGGGIDASDKTAKINPAQHHLGQMPSQYVNTNPYKVAQELNRQSGRHGVVMIDTTKVPHYKDHVDLRQYAKKNKDKFTGAMENDVMKEKAKLIPQHVPAEACTLLSRRGVGEGGGLFRRAGGSCKKEGGVKGNGGGKVAAAKGAPAAKKATAAAGSSPKASSGKTK